MRLFTVSIAVLSIAGCASPAPKESADVAAAPAAKSAPNTTSAASQPSGTSERTAAVKVYPGYKAKEKNGTTVYCKKVARIGSNFTDEMCLTAADMDALNDKAQEDREAFRRNQTICGTGGCGGT